MGIRLERLQRSRQGVLKAAEGRSHGAGNEGLESSVVGDHTRAEEEKGRGRPGSERQLHPQPGSHTLLATLHLSSSQWPHFFPNLDPPSFSLGTLDTNL